MPGTRPNRRARENAETDSLWEVTGFMPLLVMPSEKGKGETVSMSFRIAIRAPSKKRAAERVLSQRLIEVKDGDFVPVENAVLLMVREAKPDTDAPILED